MTSSRNSSGSGAWRIVGIDSRIEALRKLQNNWDGEGAEPIDEKVLERVKRIVEASDLGDYHLIPMRNGGVQFEWNTPLFDFEVEINPDGEIALLVVGTWDAEKKHFAGEVEVHIPS